MSNISALSQVSNAANALSGLILATPQTVGYQPQNPPNPDGTPSTAAPPPTLVFNYEGEQTVAITSDITDYFVEDNTAIQDQISLKPEIITTHGFIGELNDVATGALAALKVVADKLTVLGGYVPQLSATALLAYNEASFLYANATNVVNSAVSAWDSITGQAGESVIGSNGLTVQKNQTKQQIAFQQFYGYWRSRTLFTIQTPWAIFQNCAIQTLRAVQDAETRMITDFEVTFKVIRFAQTITLQSNTTGNFQGRAAIQAGSPTDLGTSTPVQSSLSFSDALATQVA